MVISVPDQPTWYAQTDWYNAYRKFLSDASQVALSASAKLSSQICHNICTPRLLPAELHRPRSNPSGAGIPRQGRSADRGLETNGTRYTQAQPQADQHADAHRPRAADRVTKKKDQKRLNGQPARRRAINDSHAHGLPHAPINENKYRAHKARRPGTVGLEEFNSNWLRYSSKYMLNAHQPERNVDLPPCDVMEVDEEVISERSERVWNSLPGPLGPPRPVEPHQNVPWLSPDRPQDTSPGLPALTTSNPTSPQATLSPTSAPPPLTNCVSSPVSPSAAPHYTFRPELSADVEEQQTAYFALYPHDHKLGFDCSCSCCEFKLLKKRKAIPTLHERRVAKRKTHETPVETHSVPQSPEESHYTFSPISRPTAPSPGPATHFLSGNVMVQQSRYTPHFGSAAPASPLMPFSTMGCGAGSWERQANGKRPRDMDSSLAVGAKLPSEEYGDSKRRRKK
ncbi:hypothetical protein DFH27DRAFT_607753 [Peziza echinospora]|nr:hypothetical protein DFH27DRAFT_607753 [Peziza echinospora]